jgi:hypothetical protein
VKYWYTWISNTTSITGETLIYMNIKHYKYNWWNINIHEYQTLQVYLVKHWYTSISSSTSITMFHQLYLYCLIFIYINVSPFMLVVFDIHVYQCFTSYVCSVRYSCISMFNTISITGETLIYMNIKHYKYNWWKIDIHEYQTLQV